MSMLHPCVTSCGVNMVVDLQHTQGQSGQHDADDIHHEKRSMRVIICELLYIYIYVYVCVCVVACVTCMR